MNPDDSQITALLDDELDPGDRTAVAWAVEASSPAAQHLAELRSAGTLIRDLDRPAIPVDLAPALLAAIAPPVRPRRRRPRFAAARFAASLVGVGSVAASLLLAMILLHKVTHETPRPALVSQSDATPLRTHSFQDSLDQMSPAPRRSSAPDSSLHKDRFPAQPSRLRGGDAADLGPVAAASPAPAPAPAKLAPVPAAAGPTTVQVGVAPEPARPEPVDAMLASRKVFRALIATPELDREARRVQAWIDRDPSRRPGFGRITLEPGLVVDADHPGAAEVYSVALDGPQVGPFLDRLRAAFPGAAVVEDPDPALVTQLGEVGQATLVGDRGAPRLGPVPAGIRQRVAVTAPHPGDFVAEAGERADPVRADLGGRPATRGRDLPAPERGGAQAAADKAKARADDEPVTVLVWVVRSPR